MNNIATNVRDAVPEDAQALSRYAWSVAKLCAADHRNDPAILQRWLGDKTAEIFQIVNQAGRRTA
jgi:hypothetical protein